MTSRFTVFPLLLPSRHHHHHYSHAIKRLTVQRCYIKVSVDKFKSYRLQCYGHMWRAPLSSYPRYCEPWVRSRQHRLLLGERKKSAYWASPRRRKKTRGGEEDRAKSGVVARKDTFSLRKLTAAAPVMSLSVPQNGVKTDNEPVIELFVKVSPQWSGTSWSN